MKILFIAPLPPPLAGHSLVAKVLHDHLLTKHELLTVDFNKESFKEGFTSNRIFEVLSILKDVWRKRKNADIIYITISESFAGNLKDLFIYFICFRKLSMMYIHLHGGSIKRLLWDKYALIYKINQFFIKRMRGVVISGESHLPIFQDILPSEKIHQIPNFALNYLFRSEEDIRNKFTNTEPLIILYMSNMINKKGYDQLADGFLRLAESYKKKIKINFAGRFELESQKQSFLDKISGNPNMFYHGMVNDEKKKSLFATSHVFCLPTSYFEGQPVSILEAYASGCVVITTGQSGILDIFTNQINGYMLEEGTALHISKALMKIVDEKDKLLGIAISNSKTAEKKYRISIYNTALQTVIES
jgi:glycosyltransferase involved in cell wall biosynthesis